MEVIPTVRCLFPSQTVSGSEQYAKGSFGSLDDDSDNSEDEHFQYAQDSDGMDDGKQAAGKSLYFARGQVAH